LSPDLICINNRGADMVLSPDCPSVSVALDPRIPGLRTRDVTEIACAISVPSLVSVPTDKIPRSERLVSQDQVDPGGVDVTLRTTCIARSS
jgi:hypothetical protein